MVTPGYRTGLAAVLLAAPVALLTGCSPDEPPSNTPGTTPSVWTGSPQPPQPESGTHGSESSESSKASENLTARLNGPDGASIATAKFEFNDDSNGKYVTVTVQTTDKGRLSPGFHGLHIHSVGKCEANSAAPAGGPPGNFLSAGPHFQAPGHSGHPQSGDLTALQVREDGSGLLVTTTDAFTKDDLLAGTKTALIIHADDDNFGNIPAERYNQVNGAPGADDTTLSTGDAGARVACGVIGAD